MVTLLAGIVFLAFGVAFPAAVIWGGISRDRFRARAVQVPGTVVRHEEDKSSESGARYTVVRFALRDGGEVVGRSRESAISTHPAGAAVTVFYDPGRPSVIDLDGPVPKTRIGNPVAGVLAAGGCAAFLGILIVPFILIGLGLIAASIFGH